MDDCSWNFFCNNSPKLVAKRRSKTPSKLNDKSTDAEMPKLLPSTLFKSKLFKHPLNLIKSTYRTMYRDFTPNPHIIKHSSRIVLKPEKLLQISMIKDISQRNISPFRNLKQSIAKKSSLKYIKKT